MAGAQLRVPCSPGCLSLQKVSLQALALDSERWLFSFLRASASGLGLSFCTTLNQVQFFKRKPSVLVVRRRLISLDLAGNLSSWSSLSSGLHPSHVGVSCRHGLNLLFITEFTFPVYTLFRCQRRLQKSPSLRRSMIGWASPCKLGSGITPSPGSGRRVFPRSGLMTG